MHSVLLNGFVKEKHMIYDAIIIGGGPSGLMAANVLEKHKIKYLILEKNDQLARKLLLTGGKRCNVTNNLSVSEFIEALNMKHKRFLYEALNRFGTKDIITFFNERGLTLLLEQNLKYFPETHKSLSVLEALTKDLDARKILFNHAVKKLEFNNDYWVVSTKETQFKTHNVILATGSNAYPTTGSSGDGLVFASYLGIETVPFTPAETHVYASMVKEKHSDLQGVTLKDATLYIEGTKLSFPGGVLFTHFGLSGPAVLHASEIIHHRLQEQEVYVYFSLCEMSEFDALKIYDESLSNNEFVIRFLEKVTSKRISKKIEDDLGLSAKRLKEISKADQKRLFEYLLKFRIRIDHTESIEKAFVNAGGISTKVIDPKTMAIKNVEGLYAIGEITDLQGPIGGFNLTIAMSTGHLAACAIAEKYNS